MVRVLRRYVLPAIVLWLTAAMIAVGLWTLVAVGTEQDPTHFAEARSYYRFEASLGHWPKSRLDQKLTEVRWQLFYWIVAEVRLPVLISALSIPLLAWLMARAGRERWVVTWLVVAVAFLLPTLFLPVGSVVAGKLSDVHQSRPAIVAPTATPVPTPTLGKGSR